MKLYNEQENTILEQEILKRKLARLADDKEDPFQTYIGKLCSIFTGGTHTLPLHGRVLSVSQDHLTIRKQNGKIITIPKARILEISSSKNQKDRVYNRLDEAVNVQKI